MSDPERQTQVIGVASGKVARGPEAAGRNINISGISTFEGQTNIGAGGTVFFADVNTQRVGINSTIPGYALDVVGDINSSTDVKIGGVSILSLTASTDDVVALAIALG